MADTTATVTGTAGLHRIEALKGVENYNAWRIRMEDILTDLDLYEYVIRKKMTPPLKITKTTKNRKDEDGNDLPDLDTDHINPDYTDWVKQDRKALSNIRLRVDGSVLTHIQSSNTSADAWDLLAATFQVKGTVGLIDLRRKFFSHRMAETEDIEERIQRMRGWFQQMNQIAPGSCTEVDWITTLVASLPDSWDTFVQSVSFKFDTNIPNELANQVSDVRSRIIAEAHRRNNRNNEGKAFFSTNKSNFNKNIHTNKNSRGPDKSKSKCRNCGKIGHWAAECRGPGGGAYKHSQQHGPNRSYQNKKFNSPGKFRGNNGRSNIATSSDSEPSDYAFAAHDKQNTTSAVWIADSGTTTHIARDRSAFTTYSRSSGYISGVTGKEPILGRGTVRLRCQTGPMRSNDTYITLQNVAHVPASPANLISLSLITEKGMRVSLERDQLIITDPNNKKILMGSKLNDRTQGNLWKVNAQTLTAAVAESESAPEMVLAKQTGRTWFEWHKVLGHINSQALKRLKDSNAVNGMEIAEDKMGLDFECEACIQSKAHVKAFPKESKTIVSDIGELVVTDVWGPARISSIGKYKYYISFTDVATRFTRLGFLRHKDETLDHYKAFEALVNTQKNKKIKRIRFDNGGEFVNKDWKAHAEQKGTVLETTAPYSAQQNGIAERLNRTLTEKARAMLLESGAPKFLWSEAIAYACYLKNRVPTQVHGKFWRTPFELFWGKKPDVSVLRPWGTKCYVLNQADNVSKLDAKTFTGIFTGISDVQGKSWRYYKTGANRIMHSRNITFPRIYAPQMDVSNDLEWEEAVVPPAEGERMTPSNSTAERQPEHTRTGGEGSVSDEKPNDSEEKGELKAIKTEVKVSPTASNSATQSPTTPTPHTQAAVPKPLNLRSTLSMPINSQLSESTRQINAILSDNTVGVRTRRGNPNPTPISLETDRGGVKIIVKDSPATELTDSSSDYSSGYESEDDDSSSISTDASSIVSAPSLLSELKDLPPYNTLGDLEEQFAELSIADTFPTSPDTPMADPTDDMADWVLATRVAAPVDNPTVEAALSGPDADKWQAAMEEEVLTLEKMGTFKIVELPVDRKAMGNKWVLTVKRNELGVDFGQTFAPVLDVRSAYLNANLNEELYMRQIPYFHDGTSRVLRLKRSLYGLKQAGHVCVYRRIINLDGKNYVAILASHVDDIIVLTSPNNTDFTINELLRDFEMRDLGAIRHYLGINIIRNRESGTITLNQKAYSGQQIKCNT